MAKLDQFLKVIVKGGGSDLHIGESQPPKMRKHGDVAPIREKPLTCDETMSMLSEVCGERNWKIFEERGGLGFRRGSGRASRFWLHFFEAGPRHGACFRFAPDENRAAGPPRVSIYRK